MRKNNFSLIKLVIFIIFFLIVLTLFLIIYIIPAMKKYKTNDYELKKYEKIYRKQQSKITFLEKKKNLLKDKYKKSIKIYEEKFDKKDFVNFINSQIKDAKIELVDKKDNSVYKISGKINRINDFDRVIDKINKYKNLVKITFPILIKKDEKLYFIAFSVTIVNKNLKKHL